MKIQQVHIKEFKCHKDFDANIEGKNILLIGENGVGKSSFIQFIEVALGKSKAVPQYAEGSGYVVATQDGRQLIFKVRFDDGKPKLTVETSDGLKSTAKGVIADLTGAMSFDIDEFVELSKKESGKQKQVQIFKSFLSQEIQDKIAALEFEEKTLYAQRTEVAREAKYLNGAMETMTGCLPCEKPSSTEELSKQLTAAINHNNGLLKQQQRLELLQEEGLKKIEETKALQARITQVETELDRICEETDVLEKVDFSAMIDASGIEQKIKAQDAALQQYNDYQNFEAKQVKYKEITAKVDALAEAIEAKRNAISETIISANHPVEGLTLSDMGLFYNGVPVDENSMSTSEIMELGFRLKLAENKDLGILFVERSESLGTKKLEALLQLAEKYNQQLIMEEVRRGEEKLKIEFIA